MKYRRSKNYKYIFRVVVLCVLINTVGFSGLSFAQSSLGKGLKFGLNRATLTGLDTNDELGDISKKALFGLAVGGFINHNFSETVSIQPEVMFTLKGAKLEGVESGVDVTSTIKLDYIEIPLLLRLGFSNSGKGQTAPYIFAGPAIGFNLNAKINAKGTADDVDVEAEQDISETTKSVDFGLALGSGLHMKNGLIIEARFTLGLSTIDDTEAKDAIKNSVFSIMAGYAF